MYLNSMGGKHALPVPEKRKTSLNNKKNQEKNVTKFDNSGEIKIS